MTRLSRISTSCTYGKRLKRKIISTIQLVSSFISHFILSSSLTFPHTISPHSSSIFVVFSHAFLSFFQMICCTTLTTSSSSHRERKRESLSVAKCETDKCHGIFHRSHIKTLFSAAASLLVQCDLMKNFVFVFTRAPLVVVPWTTSHHQHVSSCSIAHPTPSSCERQQCVCVRSLLCLSYFRIHKSLCWCFYRESHTIFKEWMIKDFINIFIGN